MNSKNLPTSPESSSAALQTVKKEGWEDKMRAPKMRRKKKEELGLGLKNHIMLLCFRMGNGIAGQ